MTTGRSAILHLGTYKTGSSSLQNLLYANRDLLAEQGVLYPQAGVIRDEVIGYRHRRLIMPFMKGETDTYVVKSLRKELGKQRQQRVVISNESWSSPRHLPMLGGFCAELEDLGFEQVTGVVFLRRLVDYKVSHYREFTLRQGNKLGYERYLLGTPGVFDYLFLVRNFRSIFGDDLRLIDYARIEDTVSCFFETTGLSALLPELTPVGKANVKPVGALGVEVMRHANRQGLERAEGLAFLSWFTERRADLFTEEWTERESPETLRYGSRYRKDLAQLLDWPPEAVEALLEDRPIIGRPVGRAQKEIAAGFKEWGRLQRTS